MRADSHQQTGQYPPRPAYFAHRAFRLMTKTCLAQEIGPDAVLLLAIVAFQEDAARYRGPVTFYDSQLLPICGFAKWERLDRARKAAASAGWLHYERSAKRSPGRYFVTIPGDLPALDDSPVAEVSFPSKGSESGSETGDSFPSKGSESGSNREVNRGVTGNQNGAPSSLPLIPHPDKKARARFTKPTVDEVADYCRERGNAVDPEAFVAHYESNGWKVGRNGMKDWQAAVRTWEKNRINEHRNGRANKKFAGIDEWLNSKEPQ